jgi:hypothetical protein
VTSLGGAFVALAAILGLAAFTEVDWFDGGDQSRFTTVHDELQLLQQSHVASGFAVAYFSWLAPLLFGVAVFSAAVAYAFGSGLVGAVATVVGFAGVACTFFGIKLVGPAAAARAAGTPSSYGGYLSHTDAAFPLMVAAFALSMISGALAVRRSFIAARSG